MLLLAPPRLLLHQTPPNLKKKKNLIILFAKIILFLYMLKQWKSGRWRYVRCGEGGHLWLCSQTVDTLNGGVCYQQLVLLVTEWWLSSDKASAMQW